MTIDIVAAPVTTLFAESPVLPSSMRVRALYYARNGWHVFPLHTARDGECSCGKSGCENAGKHPRTRHGLSDATTDATLIERWWATWPDANIGVHPGPSGFVVLDLDSYKANFVGVELTFAEKQTVTSITGSGGEHLFFSALGAHFGSKNRLVDGVDIKGWGGYVVLPPSMHVTGNRYGWELGFAPWEFGLAPLPAAIIGLLQPPARARSSNGRKQTDGGGDEYEKARIALSRLRADRADDYDDWLRVGMALAELGDPGFVLWDEWSQGSAKYRDGDTANKWPTFKPAAGVTLATLHFMATQDSPMAAQVGRNGAQPAIATESQPEQDTYPDAIRQTDLGNALRMAKHHGENLMHIQTWGKWYVWNGRYWREDETNEVRRLARDTVRRIYAEAAGIADDETRKGIAKWGMSSESRFRLEAMVALAKDDERIARRFDELDSSPWLLNVANGTIDLQTGQLRPHDRKENLTKIIPIAYDMKAEAPLWMKFLRRVLSGDENMVEFVQRAVGYSLTGDTTEQCLFFLWGTGRNGKSTFIETIRKIVADYGKTAPRELVQLRSDNSEGIPNDVAQLPGIRFVYGSELEQGRRMAESKIKDLTGGDRISARFMRGEFFDFSPRFKIWLFGNHKPVIVGTDEGIWRRIRLIEFTVYIPDEEVDPRLQQKLEAELPGILRWAVEGCAKWQRDGLNTPAKVNAATASYRAGMDILGQFIESCCVIDKRAEVPFSALYNAYDTWCKANGEHTVSGRKFGDALTERGYLSARTNQAAIRVGIGLLADATQ